MADLIQRCRADLYRIYHEVCVNNITQQSAPVCHFLCDAFGCYGDDSKHNKQQFIVSSYITNEHGYNDQ